MKFLEIKYSYPKRLLIRFWYFVTVTKKGQETVMPMKRQRQLLLANVKTSYYWIYIRTNNQIGLLFLAINWSLLRAITFGVDVLFNNFMSTLFESSNSHNTSFYLIVLHHLLNLLILLILRHPPSHSSRSTFIHFHPLSTFSILSSTQYSHSIMLQHLTKYQFFDSRSIVWLIKAFCFFISLLWLK